jgi:hypothetical protein
MFYDASRFVEIIEGGRDDRTHGIIVMTPPESRRILAKGMVALPEIQRSLDKGLVVVCRGITTAYVVEELLGITLDKANCTAGIVTEGILGSTNPDQPLGPWVIRDGKLSEQSMADAMAEVTAQDVVVKGVNALDSLGNVGVLSGNNMGGTVGDVWGIAMARGTHLITPVGLEKLVPSVAEAARTSGQELYQYVMGGKVGLVPIMNAAVVTEVEALAVLGGVEATLVAAGGVAGSEGSVVMSLAGSDERVRDTFELVKSVKGEPVLDVPNLWPAVVS